MEPELTTETHIFFWNSIYSQWFRCSFEENGITYNSAEQYMMAKKALLFGDKEIYEKIMMSSNPGNQKKYGRQVKGYSDEIWEQYREDIVTRGNYLKFSQNPSLKLMMLRDKDKFLVEASPYDRIWGIGLAPNDPNVTNESEWRGLNLLGVCIMKAREQILKDLIW